MLIKWKCHENSNTYNEKYDLLKNPTGRIWLKINYKTYLKLYKKLGWRLQSSQLNSAPIL